MTFSGMITLEKNGKQYTVSAIHGLFTDPLLRITSDYFGDLMFIANCLDYNESKLDRGGSLKTNNVSITRTPTDKYDIRIGLDSITLCKLDMVDLMKCLKTSEWWDNDEIALKYGLKEDPKPLVRTIRDKKSFVGYSPGVKVGHFALGIEKDGHVRIYHRPNLVDWVDMFNVDTAETANHIKQALIMVKDCMNCEQSIRIASSFGVFYYHPDCGSTVEIVIDEKQEIIDKSDISDLIRVIDLIG